MGHTRLCYGNDTVNQDISGMIMDVFHYRDTIGILVSSPEPKGSQGELIV